MKSNLLTNLQFGFRKVHSASDAFLTINGFIPKALDPGCEVWKMGLLFTVSFYRVNHKNHSSLTLSAPAR